MKLHSLEQNFGEGGQEEICWRKAAQKTVNRATKPQFHHSHTNYKSHTSIQITTFTYFKERFPSHFNVVQRCKSFLGDGGLQEEIPSPNAL